MINNRQNGRRRGRGGGNPRQGGGGGGQGHRDSGNRIDSRARGNAAQLLEKYRNLARDAQMQGDRVNTEYYLQFADHYFRVLADQRGRSDDQQPRPRQRDDFDPFDNNFDGGDDFGDEGDMIRADELPRGNEGDGRAPRDNGRESGRENGREARDGNRDASRDGNRDANRDGSREERRPRRDREDRRETMAESRFQPAAEPANDFADAAPEPAEERRPRRGRKPREDRVEAAGDGEAALGIDRLPPALGVTTTAGGDEEEAPKPRRRRVRTATPEASAAE